MKSITFFATLLFIIVLAAFAQLLNLDKEKQQRKEYQFDVVDDSTIIISGGNNGNDWYTISADSLKEFITEDNQ